MLERRSNNHKGFATACPHLLLLAVAVDAVDAISAAVTGIPAIGRLLCLACCMLLQSVREKGAETAMIDVDR